MTTWAELLAEIRLDIKDTSEKPKFSDDLLYLYAKDAIRDYSMWLPLRKRVVLEVEGTSAPLPADYLGGPKVECPANTYLEERLERPGNRYATTSYKATTFAIEGGRLYLNGAPLGELILTYDALHPLPASKDDSDFELSIPDLDLELLRLFVKAKVYGQVRTTTANLDRFKLGGSRRDDNPIAPEVGTMMDEYLAKMAERMGGGVVRLWRPGRPR